MHGAAMHGDVPDDVGADIDALDDEGWSALHYAAWNGHESAVKRLLAAGADVNVRACPTLSTALHYAAGMGYPNVVRTLVDAGADTTARDADRRTPALVVDCIRPDKDFANRLGRVSDAVWDSIRAEL